MSNTRCLLGEDIFFDQRIPINVMIAEHSGRGGGYHSHAFYEFVYIDRGFSTHYYNNITSLLTPGDVFGMRPGDIHGYIYPINTVLYNCLFSPVALESEYDKLTKLPGLDSILTGKRPPIWQRIHLDPLQRKEAAGYLDSMMSECRKRELGWELKLKSLLVGFLILFSRAYTSGFKKEDQGEYSYTRYMYKALEKIEKDYSQNLMIEELASKTGLSTDYFSRLFKQFTGLTPSEYIRNVRLAKAVELLTKSGMSVHETARVVGFEDPGYFARQFKQTLGISPSAYQKENAI